MTMRSYSKTLTTDGSGDATDYTAATSGRVVGIHYTKNGTTPYANGVDFTITNETTGETIWAQSNVNASVSVRPRLATHNNDYPALARHRIKIVVAQGGASKIGAFLFVVDG